MKSQACTLPTITLIGLTARTNNTDEMNPDKSKIATLAGDYWTKQIANNIKHRKDPGVTFSVYTDYESDEHGEYTYFIGEAVTSLENQDLTTFKTISIPASAYTKFTTNAGPLPDTVIQAWQAIWQMDTTDFHSERAYIADFEIYDEKATDPNNAVVDIYIGLKD